MAKKVKTRFRFNCDPTLELILGELPFLNQIKSMPATFDKCDERFVRVDSSQGIYQVTETCSGFGGEGGVEARDYTLGEYTLTRMNNQLFRKVDGGRQPLNL